MEKLPWLDYIGQTTPELLACKSSHRIDSLLRAFEEGIQAKRARKVGGRATVEEDLVLAVMGLDREVNNGGYHQFFFNSTRKFVTKIVACLLRIECAATAAITERAIAALGLAALSASAVRATVQKEDSVRDAILDGCDREFYRLNEIEANLFRFVEANQDRIRLEPLSIPPQPPRVTLSNASRLFISLMLTKKTGHDLDRVRQIARELAAREEDPIPVTEAELEGAAVLHAFDRAVGAGDHAACERLAPRAFELMSADVQHGIVHRKWVLRLVADSRLEAADAAALTYLEYLKSADRSTPAIQGRVKFWADALQEHRAALPESVRFFTANFPEVDLDTHRPTVIIRKARPAPPG